MEYDYYKSRNNWVATRRTRFMLRLPLSSPEEESCPAII